MSRGHDLKALLHEYPVDLVLNLHRAALENRKDELKSIVIGYSVAVINALDTATGGKGEVLQNWLKGMDGVKSEKSSPRASTLSPDAKAFFQGLPPKR